MALYCLPLLYGFTLLRVKCHKDFNRAFFNWLASIAQNIYVIFACNRHAPSRGSKALVRFTSVAALL